MYRTAFPNIHVTIEDQIAEGDKVVTRWTGHGTHQGELMGIPPTNKAVTVTGIAIDRIVAGKIVEHWENFDQLGMLVQLGVVPPPGG
jgi:predicted ester cyclase